MKIDNIEYMTALEASKLLYVSTSTVRNLIKDKKLSAIRYANKFLIPVSDVKLYMQSITEDQS